MGDAPRKGRCHACIACCRGCSAGLAKSVLATQLLVGLSIVTTFSMAVFSLVETKYYTTTINTWRILQSGLTCVVGVWAAYAVGRASGGGGATQLWLTGVAHVLSGLIFFVLMCFDANTVSAAVLACESGGWSAVACYSPIGTAMALLDVVLVILLTLTGAVLLERRKVKAGGTAHAAAREAPPLRADSAAEVAPPKKKSMGEALFGSGAAAGESV